jgi:hypothetical protein
VIERELALVALVKSGSDVSPEALDRRAHSAAVTGRTSPAASAYVRRLLALLQCSGSATAPDYTSVVVPVRIADRLRATGHLPKLRPADMMVALHWELAAVLAGQTMTEWATLAFVQTATRVPQPRANPRR